MAAAERHTSYSKLTAALVVRPHAELAKRTLPPESHTSDDDEEPEPKSGTFLVEDRKNK